MKTIARIRRAYFVQGKTIKAICRELRVSRKVVRKVIRSGETAFVYERRVQPQPKLGAWRGELEKLLAANVARPTRERLTLVRLFAKAGAELVAAKTVRRSGCPTATSQPTERSGRLDL